MKAWTIKEPGGIEQLVMVDRPIPEPTENEVLIKVAATAINRLDIYTRENKELEEPYPILGVEVSGVVVKESPNYPDLKEGTRVAGITNRNAYAEYAVMHAGHAMRIPDSMSFIEAAAIPEVFLTAYQTMFWLGELKPQQTILVHAAGSGVGTAAIQLASRKITDAQIIATAGRQQKLDMAKALGAKHVINYKEEDFAEKVLEYTDGKGADVILDFIGGSYYDQNLKAAAIDARWIFIGTLGGANVPQFSIRDIMGKRISLKGTLLSPRDDEYKEELSQEFAHRIMGFFDEDIIQPIIHSVLDFDDIPEAHRQLEADENTGKIVIDVSGDDDGFFL